MASKRQFIVDDRIFLLLIYISVMLSIILIIMAIGFKDHAGRSSSIDLGAGRGFFVRDSSTVAASSTNTIRTITGKGKIVQLTFKTLNTNVNLQNVQLQVFIDGSASAALDIIPSDIEIFVTNPTTFDTPRIGVLQWDDTSNEVAYYILPEIRFDSQAVIKITNPDAVNSVVVELRTNYILT